MPDNPFGFAALDLGLGDPLSAQVKDETEEQRKKRLLLQQQRTALGPAAMSLGLGGFGQAMNMGGGLMGRGR
jgi:hypothetical protein